MELGIYTFAETTPDPTTGVTISAQQRLADLMEEIELADQVGLDVFGVGEHHRSDFSVSSPAVVLAAAASRTKRIRLTSAVTVLSSDDPVRVFQDFSTLDLLSNGRAEIMAGRGSFIESFPLFGYDLADYERLFEEKLELMARLLTEVHRTVSQQFEAPIPGLDQKGFALWDANLVWRSQGNRYEFGLHGKNLANKKYIVAGYNFVAQNPYTGEFTPGLTGPLTPTLGKTGVLTAYYGNPRQVFLSAAVNF